MSTGGTIALVSVGAVVVGGGVYLLTRKTTSKTTGAAGSQGTGAGWQGTLDDAFKALGSAFNFGSKYAGSSSSGGGVSNSSSGSAGATDNYDYGYNVDDLVNNDYGG